MISLTPEKIQSNITRLGYKWFDTKPNLIGIRVTSPVPDMFNDTFALVWKQPEILNSQMTTLQKQVALNKWLYLGEDGKPLTEDGKSGKNTRYAEDDYNRSKSLYRIRTWTITTLPGKESLETPVNSKGCAIMKPGQYVDAYIVGFHKSKEDHPALLQRGTISVYRDNDKDDLAEETVTIDTGSGFGCNIHRSNKSGATPRVGSWSAGCQVFQTKTDHDKLMLIANAYKALGNTAFTYTLVKEADLQ